MPVVVQVMVEDVEKFPDIVTTAPVDTVTADAITAPPVVHTAVVALRVKAPVSDQMTSAEDVSVRPAEPTVTAAVPASVTVAPTADGLAIWRPWMGAVAVLVTVYEAPDPATLELASKIATSAAPGTLAPPAPPDVADHCVVVAVSQVPVPPTQYLFAIYASQ